VQDPTYSSHEGVYCDKWMAHPSALLTVVAVCDSIKWHCACTKRFHCLHVVAADVSLSHGGPIPEKNSALVVSAIGERLLEEQRPLGFENALLGLLG